MRSSTQTRFAALDYGCKKSLNATKEISGGNEMGRFIGSFLNKMKLR